MAYMIPTERLPHDFSYPREFLRLLDIPLIHLDPWHIMDGEILLGRYANIQALYPSRQLVPFARRQDNDDLACWDLDAGNGTVARIHEGADLGREQREEYADIFGWLRAAVEDLIEFE